MIFNDHNSQSNEKSYSVTMSGKFQSVIALIYPHHLEDF